MRDYRVGQGYDVHRLTPGTGLVLGGVDIPWEYGFIAHSDGDVLVHALCDALLGAAGLGDIGTHFPDTDPKYKGISSVLLLEQVTKKLKGLGFEVWNVDITIVAQAPKLSPYIPGMKDILTAKLEIPTDRLNIKATTEEGLGFTGNLQGISAFAVVTIYKA